MLTSTITPRTSKQLTMVLQLDKVDKTLIVANQLELGGGAGMKKKKTA